MQLLSKHKIVQKMNKMGSERTPFVFIIDFKGETGYIIPQNELIDSPIVCQFPNFKNELKFQNAIVSNIHFEPKTISQEEYLKIFNSVHQEICYGNSYLLNLTFATPIGENLPLESIYNQAKAPYKILFDNQFLCYSPKSFVKIKDNQIFSYPMKGTIDASLPNAQQQLLDNKKELYEHYTIVDLIRNDLSMVSERVEVTLFRFFDTIKTQTGAILQTISEIKGELPEKWHQKVGDIIMTLLPAGSISGAPKKKTIEIILENETTDRGFYTGVTGFFDGQTLDSCVMIRFIKQDEQGNCFYHSGGGITALSHGIDEYQELIAKIYVPIS